MYIITCRNVKELCVSHCSVFMYCVFMIQRAVVVYLYSFNCLYYMMKMRCVFGVKRTELWGITKMYGDQKALPRHPTIYLLHCTLADIRVTFWLICSISHTNTALRLVPSEYRTNSLPSLYPFQPDIPTTTQSSHQSCTINTAHSPPSLSHFSPIFPLPHSHHTNTAL
jgi:hypothetical protein